MTQTLTTERLKQLAGFKGAPAWGEEERSMAAELLRYREAAETPSCWEIAGQLFTTKEEALKPGYRGTPEPLYDGPVLTDDREAQPVAIVESSAYVAAAQIIGDEPPMKAVKELYEGALVIGQHLYTAPPAPAPALQGIDKQAIADRVYSKCLRIPGATFYNAAEFAIDEIGACLAAAMNSAAQPAPAVPEEMKRDPDADVFDPGFMNGWNACRAAMLAVVPEVSNDA